MMRHSGVQGGYRWLGLGGALLVSVACGGKATLGESDGTEAPPGSAVRINVSALDKIDLVLMVDNSISMADKQQILSSAVPEFVNRLVTPRCVDSATRAVTARSSAGGCPAGSAPEFQAVEDIHIGVITSSLGGHGGTLCTPEHGVNYWNETQNDRGWLVSRTAVDPWAPDAPVDPVPTFGGLGFLSWDPSGTARNPSGEGYGIATTAELISGFSDLVLGAGEQGCGYEAQLEAWYRFLVDPAPPLDVVFDPNVGETVGQGVDDLLLSQRAAFLRPDSAVVILMITDEDDCSVLDSGVGFLVGDVNDGAMPRSTSICDSDPNDPCCLSCIQAEYPEECDDPLGDPACLAGYFHANVNSDDDRLNLRCWQQKRRFGLDLLYPTSRYIEALTRSDIEAADGSVHQNPLFAPSSVYPDLTPRMAGERVFLAGIVGVPWQDIATDASLADPVLMQYLSVEQIAARGIWDDILGDPHASPPVPPNDPFMIATHAQRSGTNPRTGISIEASRPGAGGNAINGHEYEITRRSDLQYACIFPLETTRDCTTVAQGVGCDCRANNEVFNRPLCENTTQHYAKAYPAPRILEVLQGVGDRAVVASTCPKNPSCADSSDPNCGYNPAAAAIVDKLGVELRGHCLEQELPVDEDGVMACRVVEVTPGSQAAPCGAGLPGREAMDPELMDLAQRHMEYLGMCGSPSNPCDGFSLCEMLPAGATAAAANYQQCLNDDVVATATGYCYIDAMLVDAGGAPTPIGNPALVDACPANERRLLRFVSPPDAVNPLPWPSATILVVCPEASL